MHIIAHHTGRDFLLRNHRSRPVDNFFVMSGTGCAITLRSGRSESGVGMAINRPAFRFLLKVAENQGNFEAEKVGHKPEKTRENNAGFLCPT
jgi:hypothetical protein